jgi:hypothetical protein
LQSFLRLIFNGQSSENEKNIIFNQGFGADVILENNRASLRAEPGKNQPSRTEPQTEPNHTNEVILNSMVFSMDFVIR